MIVMKRKTTIDIRNENTLTNLGIEPSDYPKEELKTILYIGRIADNLIQLNKMSKNEIKKIDIE